MAANNSNGFRIPPQPSKKEAQRKLETEVANLQMAGRISQMMLQQIMKNVESMSKDLNASIQQQMELQYKLDAVSKHLSLDAKVIGDIANQQRLIDFNDASAKADVNDNLVSADEVGADSTIVISSNAQDAEGQDRGIFRSRLKLSESGVPDMIASLQGKKVGDIVTTKLNGLDHAVELLAIRNPAPQVEAIVAVTPEVVQ